VLSARVIYPRARDVRPCCLLLLAALLLTGRALLRCLWQFGLVHCCWWLVSLWLFPAGCFRLLLAGALLSPAPSPLPIRLARLGPFFFSRLGCVGWLLMCCLWPSRLRRFLCWPVPSRLFLAICDWLHLAVLPFLSPEPVKLARLGPSFFRLGWAVASAFWCSGIFLFVAWN
jgi:hypothetical protein